MGLLRRCGWTTLERGVVERRQTQRAASCRANKPRARQVSGRPPPHPLSQDRGAGAIQLASQIPGRPFEPSPHPLPNTALTIAAPCEGLVRVASGEPTDHIDEHSENAGLILLRRGRRGIRCRSSSVRKELYDALQPWVSSRQSRGTCQQPGRRQDKSCQRSFVQNHCQQHTCGSGRPWMAVIVSCNMPITVSL